MKGNSQANSSAYEEFLRWKNSMAGQSLAESANATIIKSDRIDQIGSKAKTDYENRGYTQDERLLP